MFATMQRQSRSMPSIGPVRSQAARSAPLPLQAKLEVGASHDPLEKEADRVADRVMRTPDGEALRRTIQSGMPNEAVLRKCAACEEQDEGSLRRKAQRAAVPCLGAPPIVHQVLQSSGQPLDSTTRAFMEPRFGHDFGRIRVHAEDRAAASSRAVGAQAYTVGRHIVFDRGRYAPHTTAGLALLAHELAHAIQQGQGQAVVQRQTATPTSGNVAAMGASEKLIAAALVGASHLDEAVIARLEEMLPGLVAGLIVWAGLHAVGAGEVIDALAGIGLVVWLGTDAIVVLTDLYQYVTTAMNAQTVADLDSAGERFAHAIATIGIDALMILLGQIGRQPRTPPRPAPPRLRSLPTGPEVGGIPDVPAAPAPPPATSMRLAAGAEGATASAAPAPVVEPVPSSPPAVPRPRPVLVPPPQPSPVVVPPFVRPPVPQVTLPGVGGAVAGARRRAPAPAPAPAGAPGRPVMPAGLPVADHALWRRCMEQHETYHATQAEAAAYADRMDPIEDDLHNRRGTEEQLRQRALEFCMMLDQRMRIVERLHRERRRYVLDGCDRFDWYNTGNTEAERRAAHVAELDAVARQLDNLRARRRRFCP